MIKRTLYFGNPAYLSLKIGQLEIRIPTIEKNIDYPEHLKSEARAKIPVEDLGLVVLDHKQITITHGLCESLLEHNVAILWCDSTHHPKGLLLPMTANDTQSEKLRYQLEASEPLKKQMWKQTVEQKIRNQAAILRHFKKEGQALEFMAKEVKSGDAGNMEARAAVKYWERIMADFGTNRGQFEGPPNNMLNYGYAILRATVARSLTSSGCLPVLGIHHRNKYNHYCLADDIMEPYRPYVDKLVLEYIYDTGSVPEVLGTDEKKALLNLVNMDVEIEGRQSPLMIATQRTSASLMKCYMGESRKIAYPEIK